MCDSLNEAFFIVIKSHINHFGQKSIFITFFTKTKKHVMSHPYYKNINSMIETRVIAKKTRFLTLIKSYTKHFCEKCKILS